MKEAANRGGLLEMNADPFCGSPDDMAFPFDNFWLDEKCEIVGDATGVSNFKCCAGL